MTDCRLLWINSCVNRSKKKKKKKRRQQLMSNEHMPVHSDSDVRVFVCFVFVPSVL